MGGKQYPFCRKRSPRDLHKHVLTRRRMVADSFREQSINAAVLETIGENLIADGVVSFDKWNAAA